MLRKLKILLASSTTAFAAVACTTVPDNLPERPTHNDPCVNRYLNDQYDYIHGEDPDKVPQERLNVETGPLACYAAMKGMEFNINQLVMILRLYTQGEALTPELEQNLSVIMHQALVDGPKRDLLEEAYNQYTKGLNIAGVEPVSFDTLISAVQQLHEQQNPSPDARTLENN